MEGELGVEIDGAPEGLGVRSYDGTREGEGGSGGRPGATVVVLVLNALVRPLTVRLGDGGAV